MRSGRWLSSVVVAVACVGFAAGQDPKPLPDAKAFDALVVDTLREVHDRGADLYNTKKDYVGTYRLYQGSLLTVKPLLAHRPEAQKLVEGGLAAAEKESDPATRAYLLHKTIEDLRTHIRSTPATTATPKVIPEAKKLDEKKPDPPMVKTTLNGTVTFDGKLVATGAITFVSLDQPKPRVVSAAIKDGKYEVELAPGKFAVSVSAPKDGQETLPQKFTTTDTSGLTVAVKAGMNASNIDLKK